MRIACLWIPELSLIAALRAEPQLCAKPLAVVQAGHDLGGRAHVLGHTPAALGVLAGQTLSEARAICPALEVRNSSPERERAAAQAAREAAEAVSPRVEEAAPGLLYLDASGLESLIGWRSGLRLRRAELEERSTGDPAVAHELVLAAERVGLRAAVGLAGSKAVARLAARAAALELTLEATRFGVGGGAFRVVAPEELRGFLDALPLHHLELPDELHEALRRFGLHTLGEVARLPPGPLAARLGADAAVLWRLARGEDSAALAPRAEAERFEEGEELEWDASSIEPLLFVWKSLLDRLSQRLTARGLMAGELSLQLRLSDGSWDERTLDLAGPSREVQPLLSLLRLSVESRPPLSGVRAVRLSALPVREVLEQMPLFGPRGASATQLQAAVARLSALVGPGRVGRPCPSPRWAPFDARSEKFTPPPVLEVPREALPPSLSARALRPPRTAEVRCDNAGTPLLVIGEGALGGRVVASAGPWRTVAEWWTEQPIALDAYDLELAGGLLVRAARELSNGAWWIEAVYD